MKFIAKTILTFAAFASFAAVANEDVDAGFIDKAKIAIAEKLRDPDSAKFRDLSMHKSENGNQCVIGYVNGKNAFGGYTGFSIFFYKADGVFNISKGGDGSVDHLMRQFYTSICDKP